MISQDLILEDSTLSESQLENTAAKKKEGNNTLLKDLHKKRANFLNLTSSHDMGTFPTLAEEPLV